MGKTQKALSWVAIIFFIILGIAMFIRECICSDISTEFWKIYVGAFAGLFTAVTAGEFGTKAVKSKYYTPIRDDDHPTIQSAALERFKTDGST